MDTFAFPKLFFYPIEETDGTPIFARVKDETGEMEIKIRATTPDFNSGELLVDSIAKLNPGETIYNVIFRNGCLENIGFGLDSKYREDRHPYLMEFDRHNFRKPKYKVSLSKIIDEIAGSVFQPLSEPIPARS